MAQEQASTHKNIFLDSDQDGLSDDEEKTYGTNPQVADTDGDGYSDGAEIQSGYDPLKSAPGDRIEAGSSTETNTPVAATDPASKNLTTEITRKIADLTSTSDASDQAVDLDKIKDIVSESLDAQITPEELPVVTKDDITIKKQDNLNGLPEDKADEIKKEDFANYIAGVSYVISSNSPTPITSSSDITATSNSIAQDFASAITSQDPQKLEKTLATGQKMIEQLKNIPVPEDLVDTHIEALKIAEYAQGLDKLITPTPDDPMLS
ncbi:MAG: hypothetical protein PHP62_05835, partial [Candidatus Moranbacteria bacterium]|nr:hypothetical protein [Candidatus Moranbacteria bacterium]